MSSSAPVPTHVDLDALDLTALITSASTLLDHLEVYNQWATAYQYQVSEATCPRLLRAALDALAVEVDLARLGLAPDPPIRSTHGQDERYAVTALSNWLLEARGGAVADWGERLTDGLWALRVGMSRLPDVTPWLARLRLIVEALRKATAARPETTLPAAHEQIPPEGTRFSEADAPAAFRDGGRTGAAVLTVRYLADTLEWELRGPYLTRNYGPGKTLTTHIKVSRAKAYLFKEVSALRTIKTANEAERQERAERRTRQSGKES
jgi:hypothetical protein